MENLRELLGDFSPLDSRSQQTAQSRPASKAAQSGMSVSFGGGKEASQPAMSGASSMSTSDVPSRAGSYVPRKPLGESNMDSNSTRRVRVVVASKADGGRGRAALIVPQRLP